MTFSIEKMRRKSDEPLKPMLNIIVSEYGTIESGRIAISPKLCSPKEVDEAVNNLIAELEEVRRLAKASLK